MRMIKIAAGLALLSAASAPGAAEPKKDEPGYNPDRQICKSRPVVGSRVQRVRECATAQQWEEMKLQERAGLMRKQMNGDRGCNDPATCAMTRGGKDTPW